MIPESGIMGGRHQNKVYRLPHLFPPGYAFSFALFHLGACTQATKQLTFMVYIYFFEKKHLRLPHIRRKTQTLQ